MIKIQKGYTGSKRLDNRGLVGSGPTVKKTPGSIDQRIGLVQFRPRYVERSPRPHPDPSFTTANGGSKNASLPLLRGLAGVITESVNSRSKANSRVELNLARASV